MRSDYKGEVSKYFVNKAASYDLVDGQHYWHLSDELLWALLERTVLDNVEPRGSVLDAGGGTGRWVLRILSARPDVYGTIFDLSSAMIGQARNRASRNGLDARLRTVVGDLDTLGTQSGLNEQYDLVLCLHNVLGFVAEPSSVVASLVKLLKPGGSLVMVVPNRYHAAYFALANGDVKGAATAIETGRGRFTRDMPEMWLFDDVWLIDQVRSCGLDVIQIAGFPVLIYPGSEDTKLVGNSVSGDFLSDKEIFRQVLSLEYGLLRESVNTVGRGNNLFIHARKPTSVDDGSVQHSE